MHDVCRKCVFVFFAVCVYVCVCVCVCVGIFHVFDFECFIIPFFIYIHTLALFATEIPSIHAHMWCDDEVEYS